MSSPLTGPSDAGDRAALLLLAVVAGTVDAVAFVELGGFFVAFMSGDATRLGIAVARHDWALAGFALGLATLFVGGVAAGRLIGDRFGARRACVLLTLEALLLGLASWLYGNGGYPHAPPLLALAMGIAATVLARDGEALAGTATMTGALIRVGDRLSRGGGGAGFELLTGAVFVGGAALGMAGDLALGGTVLRWPAAVLLLLAVWRWYRD